MLAALKWASLGPLVHGSANGVGAAELRDALRRGERRGGRAEGGRARRRLWLALGTAMLLAACGGDDHTTLTGAETEAGQLTPEPVGESHTLSVLAEPDSTDAVCRLIGVSTMRGDRSGRDGCSAAVERCQSDLRAVLGAGDTPQVGVPSGDLEQLVGCPLTFAQLDACVGDALARGVASYGDDVGCDEPAPPAIDTLALFASPQCLTVVVLCPRLIENLVQKSQ
jgi:hypothetical protein